MSTFYRTLQLDTQLVILSSTAVLCNTVDKSKRQEFLVQVITTGTVGDSWVAAVASATSSNTSTTIVLLLPHLQHCLLTTTMSTATLGWQPLLLGGAAVSLVWTQKLWLSLPPVVQLLQILPQKLAVAWALLVLIYLLEGEIILEMCQAVDPVA